MKHVKNVTKASPAPAFAIDWLIQWKQPAQLLSGSAVNWGKTRAVWPGGLNYINALFGSDDSLDPEQDLF